MLCSLVLLPWLSLFVVHYLAILAIILISHRLILTVLCRYAVIEQNHGSRRFAYFRETGVLIPHVCFCQSLVRLEVFSRIKGQPFLELSAQFTEP